MGFFTQTLGHPLVPKRLSFRLHWLYISFLSSRSAYNVGIAAFRVGETHEMPAMRWMALRHGSARQQGIHVGRVCLRALWGDSGPIDPAEPRKERAGSARSQGDAAPRAPSQARRHTTSRSAFERRQSGPQCRLEEEIQTVSGFRTNPQSPLRNHSLCRGVYAETTLSFNPKIIFPYTCDSLRSAIAPDVRHPLAFLRLGSSGTLGRLQFRDLSGPPDGTASPHGARRT